MNLGRFLVRIFNRALSCDFHYNIAIASHVAMVVVITKIFNLPFLHCSEGHNLLFNMCFPILENRDHFKSRYPVCILDALKIK